MDKSRIRKTIYVTLFLINSTLLVFALIYFFNGSLESFPTEEQQEKNKIMTGGLLIIFLMIELFLILKNIFMKKVLKIIGYIIGILLIIRFTYPLIFPIYKVATDSMEPTINKGDYIMVSKLHYKFFDLSRDDIVMFKPVDGVFSARPWTHRIIGISGDVISIQGGLVTVNGNKTFFPEIMHENLETTVEKGHVFQKGDNRKTIVGELPEDEIIGKVIYIIE